MKLTTLNLQGFVDWQRRQPAILEYLAAEQPDIILFQEVVYLPEVAPFNQVQLLNRALNYPYEHSTVSRLQVGIDFPVYREGLALLSRHPVTRSDVVVLQQAPGDAHNRIVQLADIRIDDHTVRVANVHFSLSDTVDYATPHLQEVLMLLDARHEQRIIAGDFNLPSLQASQPLWHHAYQSTETVPYVSFPSQQKRIDYALVPRSMQLTGLSTSPPTLSDHLAVTINVALTPQAVPAPLQAESPQHALAQNAE